MQIPSQLKWNVRVKLKKLLRVIFYQIKRTSFYYPLPFMFAKN